MAFSNATLHQWNNSGNTKGLSNLMSSASMSSTSTTNSALLQSLPAPLAAPPGWHSEIVYSDAPSLSVQTNVNASNTQINQYQEDYTTDSYNTSQVVLQNNNNNNQLIHKSLSDSAVYQEQQSYNDNLIQQQQQQQQYMDNSRYIQPVYDNNVSYQQKQTLLTEQQQQNLIQQVERQNPLVVRKRLPNNLVTYKQNISVRYLKPPTPPPQAPIIIREVRPPPPPPQSPIHIRQRPAAAPSPPPLVLRERPPPLPPRTSAQVVEKLLPPLPRPPRRIIVERFPECPPKPSDVIIERWLPYKQSGRRRVLIERAQTRYSQPQEPNLLIIHDAPHARIRKEFINEGVVRADPETYLQRYGAELSTRYADHSIVDEAVHAVPPPRTATDDFCYRDEYQRAPSPYLSSSRDRTRYETSIPRSASYNYGSSYYDSPYSHCAQSSRNYGRDSYRSYDDSYPSRGNYTTMTDVTSSWNRYCNSSSSGRYSSYPSSFYNRYSSCSPEKTIRVSSDNEFRNVLCDLTNGRLPSELI